MGKHTEDMPKDVKVAWSVGIGVVGAATIVVLGIPVAILLLAFPQVLFAIAFLLFIGIGGYVYGKKSN